MTVPRRRRTAARYCTNGRIKDRKTAQVGTETEAGSVWVNDIAPGDASVTVGQSIKYWQGDPADGFSIEASCAVTLSCAQEPAVLDEAQATAAELSLDYALDTMETLEREGLDFIKGGR